MSDERSASILLAVKDNVAHCLSAHQRHAPSFAHEAGLHRIYVSNLEPEARNPMISVVDKVAVASGVTVGALPDALGDN